MTESDKKKISGGSFRKPVRGTARLGTRERDLVRRVSGYLSRHRLWRGGDPILVAVSGGADSVALLHLLLRLGREAAPVPTVVHLDHGLRGAASRDDRVWVESLAARLGLPCRSGRREVGRGRSAAGSSPEEAARRVRYGFFREVSRETGIGTLSLGHQADDQAETVLLRLLRGTSPAGLAGMRPVRQDGDLLLVRPLLGVRREELLEFLEEIGEDWREDRTNRDLRFLRNRIRHELLPLLESEYNPRIRELLVELAEREGELEDYLRERWEERSRRLIGETESGLILDCRLFRSCPALVRGEVLRRLLARAGVLTPHRRHFRALEALASGSSGRRIDLPGPVRAFREGERIVISPSRQARTISPCELEIPGEAAIEELAARIRARIVPVPPASVIRRPVDPGDYWDNFPASGPLKVYLDRGRVDPPLTVRSRRPGDRYRPLGMGGSKKLKDILIDNGIPLSRRGLIPVIADREKILWPAGCRPEHLCRVREGTKEVLEISLEPAED